MRKALHSHGLLIDLAQRGVRHLGAFCQNDAGQRQAITDVLSDPSETPVPWFRSRVNCGGRRVDVGPNWKEKPGSPADWSGRSAWEQ